MLSCYDGIRLKRKPTARRPEGAAGCEEEPGDDLLSRRKALHRPRM
jgi:hypothetical protein